MADYEGKTWFRMFRGSETANEVVANGEQVYMGNIIEKHSGYARQFDPADDKDIRGIWTTNGKLGNATLTENGEVTTKFTLTNCYLAGVAVTDDQKPVWAMGEDAGCNASAAADLSLTYSETAKLLGFVQNYVSANKADIYVDPIKLTKNELPMARFDYTVVVAGGAGSMFYTKTFAKDVIVRKLKCFIHTAFNITKGVDIVVNTGTDEVTGTMQIRSTDAALTEKTQALTGDYLYVTAGTAIKLEYKASEGVAADAGEVTFSIEVDEIPECPAFVS